MISDILANLNADESIKFSKTLHGDVQFVVKRGDESAEHLEVSRIVSRRQIDKGAFDVLAFEINRAIEQIREAMTRQEADAFKNAMSRPPADAPARKLPGRKSR